MPVPESWWLEHQQIVKQKIIARGKRVWPEMKTQVRRNQQAYKSQGHVSHCLFLVPCLLAGFQLYFYYSFMFYHIIILFGFLFLDFYGKKVELPSTQKEKQENPSVKALCWGLLA